MVREGDFFEIPLADGRIAVAWVLLVSKQFKNTVGFVVFGLKGQTQVEPEAGTSAHILGPYYTHVDNLDDFGCRIVDHADVPESKRDLTRRRVGGGVYIGDDYVGSVEEIGGDLRPMLFMGMELIANEITESFGSHRGNQ